MRMLCDKHSKDYLKIKPYQKDTAGQQAHKTETSVVCAHYPPMLNTHAINYTFLQKANICVVRHVKFFR